MNNWIKIGAVVLGAIVVFAVFGSVVHLIIGALTAVFWLAVVGGGVYAASRIAKSRKRRELGNQAEYRDAPREPRDPRTPRSADADSTVVRPQPGPVTPYRPAAEHDVESDLDRLKREMGQ